MAAEAVAVVLSVVVAVAALEEAEVSVIEEAVEAEVAVEADSVEEAPLVTVVEVPSVVDVEAHQDSQVQEKCYEHHHDEQAYLHSVIEIKR